MKYLILSFFIISLLNDSYFSQNFVDYTSKRTYTAHDSGGNFYAGYQSITIVKDTFYQGHNAKIFRAEYKNISGQHYYKNFYIYQSGDTVYQFVSGTGSYEVKFIFNLNQGDTVDIFPNDHFAPSSYYVDTVFNIQIDSITLKQYELKLSFSTTNANLTLIDRIGFKQKFNLTVMHNPGGIKYSYIKCYSDFECDTNYSSYPCDFMAYNNLSENSLNTLIQLYPNPSNQILNINYGELEVLAMSLFTIQGKERSIRLNNKDQLDVSNLPQGIYFLKVKTNAGTVIKKWVKE